LPITFLWNLTKPRLEKVLIGILMALGLMASASAIVKSVYIARNLNVGADILPKTLFLSIWAKMEELLGIIAACAPALKSPAERVLRRLGVIGDRGLNCMSNSGSRNFRDASPLPLKTFAGMQKSETETMYSETSNPMKGLTTALTRIVGQEHCSEGKSASTLSDAAKQNKNEEENPLSYHGWQSV
jgi:hypothetical protein